MVLSPVIPIFAPFAKAAARGAGVEVIGEIELGYRFSDRGAKFVCISGTNGKTTTTALTGGFSVRQVHTHMFLGNIGRAYQRISCRRRRADYVSRETAALQLESIDSFRRMRWCVNISEDHLTALSINLKTYIAAKCRGFENRRKRIFAVLNYDDSDRAGNAALDQSTCALFFTEGDPARSGMFLRDGRMIFRMDGVETPLIQTDALSNPRPP